MMAQSLGISRGEALGLAALLGNPGSEKEDLGLGEKITLKILSSRLCRT